MTPSQSMYTTRKGGVEGTVIDASLPLTMVDQQDTFPVHGRFLRVLLGQIIHSTSPRGRKKIMEWKLMHEEEQNCDMRLVLRHAKSARLRYGWQCPNPHAPTRSQKTQNTATAHERAAGREKKRSIESARAASEPRVSYLVVGCWFMVLHHLHRFLIDL